MIRAATRCSAASPTCCKTQRRDGSWDEQLYTGTGFPRVFYLEYSMYRQYFPLLALTIVQQGVFGTGGRAPRFGQGLGTQAN